MIIYPERWHAKEQASSPQALAMFLERAAEEIRACGNGLAYELVMVAVECLRMQSDPQIPPDRSL
ncbi:hypothetical protein [Magnetospirillum sp. SS-4]|uniref:hypothetical protein n=1 Tax=Magnetospirillum sp. SS-4 TaxID=2681465 RepID=UPI001380C511|nr:hypothetical protein [Magnetospirillum sp. SS-4]CAA7614289.1 hypothetical protein MTBSS4_110048 [Magnetospirillum sp. SS-4]